MTRCSGWVSEVKNDLDTPDLWAELWRQADLLRGAYTEAGDNTPFTRQEQEEIERRLRELEAQVMQTSSFPERKVEYQSFLSHSDAIAGDCDEGAATDITAYFDWRGDLPVAGTMLPHAFPGWRVRCA